MKGCSDDGLRFRDGRCIQPHQRKTLAEVNVDVRHTVRAVVLHANAYGREESGNEAEARTIHSAGEHQNKEVAALDTPTRQEMWTSGKVQRVDGAAPSRKWFHQG